MLAAMLLPPLPPDLEFPPLPKTEDGVAFSFAVKKAALGPYVAHKWGWEDGAQMRHHRERLKELSPLQILRGREAIGTLSLTRADDHLRLDEFYLLPPHQHQGIGTRVLRHCAAAAAGLSLPLRLRYLKWNPVGALYRRAGFIQTGETEILRLMEWRPPAGGNYA